MNGVFFERLHPDNITPQMLSLIEESKKWDDDQTATNEILGLLAEGEAQLWYFQHETDHAILITQVIEDKGENHVFIWRLFGKGLLPVYSYIEDRLMDFARMVGAITLQTETHTKGAEVLCSRGFQQDHEVLVKEVHYGQAY